MLIGVHFVISKWLEVMNPVCNVPEERGKIKWDTMSQVQVIVPELIRNYSLPYSYQI